MLRDAPRTAMIPTMDWAEHFRAAALEPDLWYDALDALARATGSDHAQLAAVGGMTPVSFNLVTNIDTGTLADFDRTIGFAPQLNFRVAADIFAGGEAIVHEHHYAKARPGLVRDDYVDFCRDMDISHGCQTRLFGGPGWLVGLALLRSDANGRTSAEEREVFAQAAGHVRAAVSLQRAIDQRGGALLSGAMEAVGRACFLLDDDGRVAHMTAEAEALLHSGRLRLADGVLTGLAPRDGQAIALAVRSLLRDAVVPAPVLLNDDRGQPWGVMEGHLLPRRSWTIAFTPRAVLVVRERALPSAAAGALIAAFGLTSAEADIALRIAAGTAREDIARERGVSLQTLKAQIRSIYGKVGCQRESQLVATVHLIAG